jgi:hypothetical protein
LFYKSCCRLGALAVTLLCSAIAQVAVLQIHFIEGEGAVHAPGSRTARPLTVEVTDETGRPVPGAAVSFHLPDEGPGGSFANGLRTVVAITDAQGRVSLHGLQLNRLPGRFQIRVVATKEQARAGVVASQYIAEPKSCAASPRNAPVSMARASAGPRTRWIVIAAIIGGGAAAGVVSAAHRTPSPAPPSPPVAAAIAAPTLSVGAPVTTVGKP